MEFVQIVKHFKKLLKGNEGAQTALVRFERNMVYASPELFFTRFWDGTLSSHGICGILTDFAQDSEECRVYFQKIVEYYIKHKELKHVEA